MDKKALYQSIAHIAVALGLEVKVGVGDSSIVIKAPGNVSAEARCWCDHVSSVHSVGGERECLVASCDCKMWSPRGPW